MEIILAIIVIIAIIYGGYLLKEKINETQVDDNGIRIKYNNNQLKNNYYLYYEKKHGEQAAKELNLGQLSKKEWMEYNKEMAIGLTDFTEDNMLIPWESVISWKRKARSRREQDYINVNVQNMELPIKVYMATMIIGKKASFFKKMALDKKEKGIDEVILRYTIIALIFLLGIFYFMNLLKNI